MRQRDLCPIVVNGEFVLRAREGKPGFAVDNDQRALFQLCEEFLQAFVADWDIVPTRLWSFPGWTQ